MGKIIERVRARKALEITNVAARFKKEHEERIALSSLEVRERYDQNVRIYGADRVKWIGKDVFVVSPPKQNRTWWLW